MKYGNKNTSGMLRKPAMRRYFSELRWITNAKRRKERDNKLKEKARLKKSRRLNEKLEQK